MSSTRREFLRSVIGASTVASLAPTVPAFLHQTARAAVNGAASGNERVLIVVQLSGGNDGLNTLVPYGDDAYGRSRKTLRLTRNQVLKIDSRLGFHPQMPAFLKLLGEGDLMVAQGIGYPKSNRSHDQAMRDWHTARPGDVACPTGWIGRTVDQVTASDPLQVPGVLIGPIAKPFALNAKQAVVPSVRVTRDLTLHHAPVNAVVPEADTACDNPLLQLVTDSTRAADRISRRVAAVLAKPSGATSYPPFTLARHFQMVTQLIRADVGIRIFFTELGGGGIGGFDNHANQRDNHAALLRELSQSIAALHDELKRGGMLDRVLLMTFSEFGRTLSENGRRGTGHGAAAPVFLMGGKLKGGLFGRSPSLTDLDQDAPKFHTDFRRLYATVLDRWLDISSRAVLGAAYAPLDMLG